MERSCGGRLLSLLLASALLCSAAAPAVGAGGAGLEAGGADGTPGSAAAVEGAPGLLQGFEADRTSFRVTVYENGSAEWRFRYERSLNESERTDFEAFAEEFNENETELFANFRKRARWLADNGSEATGREMSAANFRRDARTEGLDPQSQDLGVVEMSFRWDGFANVTSDGVVAGDVFEGGLYIGPNQKLVFVAGPNLSFVEAQPAGDDRVISGDTLADSDAVTWTGEKSFTDQRPRVVIDGTGQGPAGTPTPTASPTGTEAGSESGWLLPAGVLLVVAALGAGGAVAYRSGALGGTEEGGPGASAEAGPDDGATGAAETTETPVGVTEEELLSDEERVVNLLEENGGRMKQVDIVKATDWSKSKVSMLLSDMEEEDRISKLRVGRENIVSLAGQEPDAAGSPFNDEE